MESRERQFCFTSPERIRLRLLADSISAIPITFGIDGRTELGPISHLPQGARLQLCGEGFNEMTAKVWWEGRHYFIFLQDLELDRN